MKHHRGFFNGICTVGPQCGGKLNADSIRQAIPLLDYICLRANRISGREKFLKKIRRPGKSNPKSNSQLVRYLLPSLPVQRTKKGRATVPSELLMKLSVVNCWASFLDE